MAHDIGLRDDLYTHAVLIYIKHFSRKLKNLFSPPNPMICWLPTYPQLSGRK